MRQFNTILIILAFLGVLTLGTATSAQTVTDPNEPDTLWIDSAIAFVTGIGVVPISFVNDEELRSVEVTLQHGSIQVSVDSFLFAGGRLDSDVYSKEVSINSDSSMVSIYSFTSDAIPVGRGLLGKLYYSYSHTIIPQVVPIDTVLWWEVPILHSTSFIVVGGGSFKPQVISGYLDIQETPASFDSVWIDNVEAAPGEPVALNVYAFNERNLAKIAFALDYSTVELAFDSVSFTGTRSESTLTKKTVQQWESLHKLYTVIEFGEDLPLPPGSGAIATLHFTIIPLTPEKVIVIDSTTVGLISNTRFTLTAVDGSNWFVPLFTPGSVDVKKLPTDVEDVTDQDNLPNDYHLAQNYPNPFNPSTSIEFSLPVAGHVQVEVFNILGRRVRRLIDRDLPAGEHCIVFDARTDRGSSLATGIYFYRLTTDGFQDTRKMLLLK